MDWDSLSAKGKLCAVIDPNDVMGYKNMLIDRVHWLAIQPYLTQDSTVLDFGCGTGRFAKRITQMRISYFGIDSSAGMIHAAQELHPAMKNAFSLFDGQHIPFADTSMDVIICARVLLHLMPTPLATVILKEWVRVLKPNGRLILLEEASLSNRKSGQAPCALTEQNFQTLVQYDFDIVKTHKVRSSEFSRFSRRITEYPILGYPVFRLMLPGLSMFELKRAKSYTDEYYKKVTYYDFLLVAQKKRSFQSNQ